MGSSIFNIVQEKPKLQIDRNNITIDYFHVIMRLKDG